MRRCDEEMWRRSRHRIASLHCISPRHRIFLSHPLIAARHRISSATHIRTANVQAFTGWPSIALVKCPIEHGITSIDASAVAFHLTGISKETTEALAVCFLDWARVHVHTHTYIITGLAGL